MSVLYLTFIVVSTVCVGLIDRRWRLFLFARPRLAVAVVGCGVAFFVAWDLAAIALGVYERGSSPAMTGVELVDELPLEEVLFIVFLCYLTLVVHALSRLVLSPSRQVSLPGRRVR
jgi:lycopene cyclase domain-containing protein